MRQKGKRAPKERQRFARPLPFVFGIALRRSRCPVGVVAIRKKGKSELTKSKGKQIGIKGK